MTKLINAIIKQSFQENISVHTYKPKSGQGNLGYEYNISITGQSCVHVTVTAQTRRQLYVDMIFRITC